MPLAFVFGRIHGCISLALFVLDIYCIVRIVEASTSNASKVVWILLVLFLPLLGAILWLLFGRK